MATTLEAEHQIAWQPQAGPQTYLLQCPDDARVWYPDNLETLVEIFYGGARGGGKTSGLLGHWIKHANTWGRYARGIIFRRSYDELEEIMDQAEALFPLLGARWVGYKRKWVFPNRATLRFRFLERDEHARKYKGRAYTWMGMEEVTDWPSPDPVDKLKSSLRSSHGVRCQWVANGNPGGPGHNWVKHRYIDPMPPLSPYRDALSGAVRIFIPAKLQDNRILMSSDPGYADRLKGSGPEWLVRAWLDGNWDIVAGGMFDDLWNRDVHIVQPFPIPKAWIVERAFDWGSSKPFSIGWWATANGEALPDGRVFYRGTKFRVGEWYGWDGKTPNKGLNLVDSEIARLAIEQERELMKVHGYQIQEGPADPSIFTVKNGMSTGQTLSRLGLAFKPAATGPGSRKDGWAKLRSMLKASLAYPKMEAPGLFVFPSCRQFIRTVPSLPRDSKDLDDVDTDAEDHIGDETRYAIMTKRAEVKMQKLVGV